VNIESKMREDRRKHKAQLKRERKEQKRLSKKNPPASINEQHKN